MHVISRVNKSFFAEHTNNFVLLFLYSIIIDIFFPSRRNDFTASGLVQRFRGEIHQLHPPRLPSTVKSTRELSRLNVQLYYVIF